MILRDHQISKKIRIIKKRKYWLEHFHETKTLYELLRCFFSFVNYEFVLIAYGISTACHMKSRTPYKYRKNDYRLKCPMLTQMPTWNDNLHGLCLIMKKNENTRRKLRKKLLLWIVMNIYYKICGEHSFVIIIFFCLKLIMRINRSVQV